MTKEFIALPRSAIDITGQRFGRLVALGPVESRAKRASMEWLCQCDCGVQVTAQVRNLRHRNFRSCGCIDKERVKPSRSIYMKWLCMIKRCTNPADKAYHSYGGRGISVCSAWLNSLEEFEFYVAQLAHYEESARTLDRIDNSGNYEPGNVRWATPIEQGRNTRRNRFITFNGRTQCIQAWADEVHMPGSTLRYRLNQGWSIEQALVTPLRGVARHYGMRVSKPTAELNSPGENQC